MGFLPKTVCNVKEVEFARAVKLNKMSIDLITFKVPRVKVSILCNQVEKMFLIFFLISVSNKLKAS